MSRQEAANALQFLSQSKPYNIYEMRAASNMLSGGLTDAASMIGSRNKQYQEYGANDRVGQLLQGMNGDNYEAEMAKARDMLPYASDAMRQQAQQQSQDIHNKRSYDIQKATFDMQKRDYDNKQQSMAAIQGLLGGNPEAYANATPEAKYAADMYWADKSDKMVGDAENKRRWEEELGLRKTEMLLNDQYRKGSLALQREGNQITRENNRYNMRLNQMLRLQEHQDKQFQKYGGIAYNPRTGKIQRLQDRNTKLNDGWVMFNPDADVSKLHTLVTKEGGRWKLRDEKRMATTNKFQSDFLGTPDSRKAIVDKLLNTMGSQWWFGDPTRMSGTQRTQLESQVSNLLNDPEFADSFVNNMNDPNAVMSMLKMKAHKDAQTSGRGEYVREKDLMGRLLSIPGQLLPIEMFKGAGAYETVPVAMPEKLMQEANDYNRNKR